VYYFHWLPIGTDPRVRSAPWVTSSVVVLNVLLYAFILASRADAGALYSLAFKAADPSVPTAIVSLFLHADPIHLLGNIVFLGVFGPPLEARLGALRYSIAYLACGWLANLAQAAAILSQRPELASVPIVGASGAISGLMGLFLVRLYFARLRFVSMTMLLFQGVVKPAAFALPAVVGIGIWLALALVYQAVGIAAATAYVAHLGGAAFGVIFAIAMGLAREGRLERHIALGDRYAERGEWFAALGEYESYLRRVPDDPEALAQAARLQRVTQQASQSAERFRESIRQWLRRGELRSACDTYEEMRRLLGGEILLPPAEQMRVARGFEELGRPSEASRAYEAYGKRYPDRHAAALAMLKSAEIQRRALNNPGRARYIYDELSRRPLPSDLQSLVEERRRVTERHMKRLEHGVAS
jgi:membrane associated rhomboid family serine protease